MRRRRLALTALALALLATFVLLASRRTPTATTPGGPGADDGPAGASPPPTLASPSGGNRRVRTEARTDASAPAPDFPRLRIRALADGRPAIGATVRVISTAKRGWPPRPAGYGEPIPVGDDGVVALDVERVLDGDGFREVRVEGALAGWIATPLELTVPEIGSEGSLPGGPPPVELAFRRVAIVVGRVLGPDGTPIAATAQAVADEDTPESGTRSLGDGVVAGDDGRFRLEVDAEGAALLLVGRGDARPATIPTPLVRGRELDVGEVRLDRGASLAGRVRCRGVAAARSNVIATWYGPAFASPRQASHGFLWVVNRRAIWSRLEVRPDAEGRFRLDGLEPGPYRLRVATEDWGCALHPDAYAEVDRIVRAPDERLDVDADRSLFQLRVLDGGEPVPSPHVSLDGRDRILLDGGAEGQVGVVLRAGARHRVVVRAKGYVRASFDVTAAEAGGRRLETVTLARAGPGDEFESPAFAREPGGATAAILGPDGLPFAVPFRFFDGGGHPVPAETWDSRPVVAIVSSTRTSVSGLTTFAQLETTEVHRYVEVGGGLLESRRIDFDGTEVEPGHRPPSVVLHAR